MSHFRIALIITEINFNTCPATSSQNAKTFYLLPFHHHCSFLPLGHTGKKSREGAFTSLPASLLAHSVLGNFRSGYNLCILMDLVKLQYILTYSYFNWQSCDIYLCLQNCVVGQCLSNLGNFLCITNSN